MNVLSHPSKKRRETPCTVQKDVLEVFRFQEMLDLFHNRFVHAAVACGIKTAVLMRTES